MAVLHRFYCIFVENVTFHITVLFLYNAMFGIIRNVEGTIFQMNYRRMTISWKFPYNSFLKFMVKKLGAT